MPSYRLAGSSALVHLTGWNDGSGNPGRLMADDWWIFEFGD